MVHDIDRVLWCSGLGLLFQLGSFGFLGCSIRFKETGATEACLSPKVRGRTESKGSGSEGSRCRTGVKLHWPKHAILGLGFWV